MISRLVRAAFRSALALALVASTSTSALAKNPPKRDLPDYDGRNGGPTTAGDVLVWIPRILLSPFYFFSEYVVRRPLGAIISGAERAKIPDELYDFFAFGADHKAGFAPYAFIDFGFQPSIGVYVFWDDAGFQGHDLSLHAATGGPDWLAAGLTDRIRFADGDTLSFHATGVKRPDFTFFGVGPRTLQSNLTRYAATNVDANAELDFDLWRASRITTTFGARAVTFSPGHWGDDPAVEGQVARGVFPLPDGYARGYTLEYNQVDAAFDTRLPRPNTGSGLRIHGTFFQGNDVRQSPASGFVRYGGTVGGFWDLNDHGRVLGLSAGVQFADPLGNQPIPFTELVSLGGYNPMRGFYPGRLYGRSAAVGALDYRWPIWAYIDGTIVLETGNVFDEHLKDFDPRLLRLSGSVGIQTIGSPDSSLEILLGAGTETIDDHLKLDSVRLLFGTNHGF